MFFKLNLDKPNELKIIQMIYKDISCNIIYNLYKNFRKIKQMSY